MTLEAPEVVAVSELADAARRRPLAINLVRLARPHQWVKNVFVLLGPIYGLADMGRAPVVVLRDAVLAAAVFSLASSACYVVNDILDVEADRAHPRKRRRPIASGEVAPPVGWAFAAALAVGAAGLLFLLPAPVRPWVALLVGLYVANVTLYSSVVKHVVIADVVGLSLGFVLRVTAGCAAVGIWPSTWLLNCTFFLSMFLAFSKRLGERRAVRTPEEAASIRAVHRAYTDDMLRMSVVVTAVATLLSYAAYVQAQEAWYDQGFNLLWLTILPATIRSGSARSFSPIRTDTVVP